MLFPASLVDGLDKKRGRLGSKIEATVPLEELEACTEGGKKKSARNGSERKPVGGEDAERVESKGQNWGEAG